MSNPTVEPKKERSRNWFLLLYPDNPDHVKVLEKIPELDWEYVGICHDNDKLDYGSPAKAHHHILLKFKEATWNTSIKDACGLELKFIQKSDNWKRSARYLVHKDHAEKFQYDKTALYGSMVEKAIEAINKSDPEEEAAKVAQLTALITGWDGHIEVADLVNEICAKKLYAEFRRGGQIFMRMVDSHNYKVSRMATEDLGARLRRLGDQEGFAQSVQKHKNDDWVDRCESLGKSGYNPPSLDHDELVGHARKNLGSNRPTE